jgi:Methyltransferase domain
MSVDIKAINSLTRRAEIAGLLPHGSVAIELGVAEGTFSELLLGSSNISFLYSVDMYAGDRGHDIDQYKRCIRRLDKHRERSGLLKLKFDQALELFPDNYFDLIYVDGYAHTGEEGGKTFADWYVKCKFGGLFGGHDYQPNHHPLVVEAVDKFSSKMMLPLLFLDDRSNDGWNNYSPSWFVQRPDQ